MQYIDKIKSWHNVKRKKDLICNICQSAICHATVPKPSIYDKWDCTLDTCL